MDELIKMVTKKAGISETQAKKAIRTVMQFLDDKLPGPIASQVEGLLSGRGSELDLDELMGGLGSLFGGTDKKK
jgi:uncharacterized protein (DUF2267 family)